MTDGTRSGVSTTNPPASASRRVVYEGSEVAPDYGDVRAEWEALDAGAGLLDAIWRRYFTAIGEERLDFLHGQTTNHLRGLAPGVGCAALTLTAQGRPLAAFAVYEDGDRVWIATTSGHGESTRAALSRFLVADDCDFESEADAICCVVAGPRAAEVLASVGAVEAAALGHWGVAAATIADEPVMLFSRGDLRVPCFEVLACNADGEASNAVSVWRTLAAAGARPCGSTAFEILRVESGTARYGIDVDERRIALEARLEWAIHFDKGCYVGQEVVERAVSRGRVNHELCLLSVAPGVEPGARVEGGGENDVVTSVVDSPRLGPIALAYLPKARSEAGTELKLSQAGTTFDARVLPWPRPRILAGRA